MGYGRENEHVIIQTDYGLKQTVDDHTSQLAQIATTVDKFGAKGDETTNDLTAIQSAIDSVSASGGGVVSLMRKHLINGTLILPSNVTLKALTKTTIKSTSNSSTLISILANTENVTIDGITFDYESTNSNIAIYIYENVNNIRLSKLEFKNFKNADPTVQQNVIRLKTGITGVIHDITFKNIKCVGNGVTADGGGAGRCIRTDSSDVTVLKNYNLNIDKIHIEDCFSINADGDLIIEDFDPIHFQHFSDVSGTINLSNVTAKNFSKRLIKIQGDGVNINNVVAETDKSVPWLISVLAKNVNISNVTAKGSIISVIEFLNTSNINVSNIQINSSHTNGTIYDSLFLFYNSSNINISQVVGNGYGGFLFFGEVTENIFFDSVNLSLSGHILHVQDRNVGNTAYTNGKISNINFSKTVIKVPSTTHNSALFDINGLGTVNPIEQIRLNDFKITANQLYPFGLFRLKNATDVSFENPLIENISSLTNPELFTLSGTVSVQIRKLLIKGTATTNEIKMSGVSNLLLTRSKINNVSMSGVDVRLELEKTPATVTYISSATSAQTTIS